MPPKDTDASDPWGPPVAVQQVAGQYGVSPSITGSLPGVQSISNQIYMGTRQVTRDTLRPDGVPRTFNEQYSMSLQEARNIPFTWSDAERDKFVRSLVLRKYPRADANMGLPEVASAWDDLVTAAQAAQQGGATTMSPWDILNTYKSREGMTYKRGDWLYDASTNQPIKYVGPRSKTKTSTSVQTMTREDALALTKDSMARMLGRAPTSGEVGRYMATLNGYAEAHPQVSTTTSTIGDQGEEIASKTRTIGGVSQAGMQAKAEEEMQKDKEYGAYQASTTYMNALMSMLGGG